MCKSQEILDSDSLNIASIPALGCWVRPSWTYPIGSSARDESGAMPFGRPDDLTCRNWSQAQAGFSGLILFPSGSLKAQQSDTLPNATSCDVSRPVACCKPIAVGEPQASVMLPAGVGVLAMLSFAKTAA